MTISGIQVSTLRDNLEPQHSIARASNGRVWALADGDLLRTSVDDWVTPVDSSSVSGGITSRGSAICITDTDHMFVMGTNTSDRWVLAAYSGADAEPPTLEDTEVVLTQAPESVQNCNLDLTAFPNPDNADEILLWAHASGLDGGLSSQYRMGIAYTISTGTITEFIAQRFNNLSSGVPANAGDSLDWSHNGDGSTALPGKRLVFQATTYDGNSTSSFKRQLVIFTDQEISLGSVIENEASGFEFQWPCSLWTGSQWVYSYFDAVPGEVKMFVADPPDFYFPTELTVPAKPVVGTWFNRHRIAYRDGRIILCQYMGNPASADGGLWTCQYSLFNGTWTAWEQGLPATENGGGHLGGPAVELHNASSSTVQAFWSGEDILGAEKNTIIEIPVTASPNAPTLVAPVGVDVSNSVSTLYDWAHDSPGPDPQERFVMVRKRVA